MKLSPRSVFPFILTMMATAALAQTPAPQTPPPDPSKTPTQVPNPAAAPPPPLPPDEYKNLSDVSLELYYWKPSSAPQMRPGQGNIDGDSSTLYSGINLQGSTKAAEGVVVTIPAGRANQLEFEYFQTQQQGNEIANLNLTLFGQAFAQGDVIASESKIQHARVTWKYLTYPDPAGTHKFRLRTLWGFEWTQMTARFDSPNDVNAAPVQDSRSIIFPSLGLGGEYHFTKRIYIDGKAEGFAWPHKAVQTDGEIRLIARLYKQLDLVASYREFHFKTNPLKDYYLRDTLKGPYAGLRWTFK